MLYRAPDVKAQPSVKMAHWRLFELPSGNIHLCGVIPQDGYDGRVSSKLVEFDTKTMTGRTRSGRLYTLIGPTGQNGDADYVLDHWLRINGVSRDSIKIVEPRDI